MSENHAERQTRRFFEILGFEVERIPSINHERRADYRITDGKNSYIVEVKGKLDDDKFEKSLNNGNLAYWEEVLGRTNPLSKQIRNAAEQLNFTPTGPDEYHIISLVAEGKDPEIQAIQFESTLYGTVDLIYDICNNPVYSRPCFFLTFNEFFRLYNIDAAIILRQGACRLCVNSFSKCLNEFRETKLYKLHNDNNAICDPLKMEEEGEAFVADCDLDRHDEPAILDYVREKYNKESLLPFKPKKYSAAIQIKKNH